MEKKGRKVKLTSGSLTDDIRASLQEARQHAAGKKTGAVAHRVRRRKLIPVDLGIDE